ncbi:hypothetical protein HPB50_020871 [Hyalomma asiaticum]|uniref:Uncharacterized protein n=1 Tax=Hyalomma asiaticum TaxID=266040 RepID=A0ACB7RQB6_HYAAI|nr:hypothetical protein HPB50_020871 [Hyalomma asiaticum]
MCYGGEEMPDISKTRRGKRERPTTNRVGNARRRPWTVSPPGGRDRKCGGTLSQSLTSRRKRKLRVHKRPESGAAFEKVPQSCIRSRGGTFPTLGIGLDSRLRHERVTSTR